MTLLNITLCIDKNVLGTSRHFLIRDGNYSWSVNVPDDSWYLNGSLKLIDKCFDSIARLNGSTIDLTPPEAFARAISSFVLPGETPPWRWCMPRAIHEKFSRRIIDDASSILKSILQNSSRPSQSNEKPSIIDYHQNIWLAGNRVLGALKKAKLNVAEYERLITSGDGNVGANKTFKPIAAGYANDIRYNRFGTRTGRLTVESGPLILTLKKEHRKSLLESRFEGGKIIELDFASLEPRVMLHEAGKTSNSVNLYGELNEQLFGGRGEQNVIKQAVIAQLYGMGKNTLQKLLNVPMETIDTFMTVITDHFETKNLLKRVKSEFYEKGHITNKFGRLVEIEVPIDRMFVNSWSQSSGADVAMLGFDQMIKSFEGKRIKPLYLIVDAMLVDCHPSENEFVKSLRSFEIAGNKYPVKITEY